MKGYMYILECANGKYYTGSTKDLERRLEQHQNGEGANFTSKHLPVKLIYYEEFDRIDNAFYREKQVQGWTRKKKDALIVKDMQTLHDSAVCGNETSALRRFDSAQRPKTQRPKTQEPKTQEPKTQRPNTLAALSTRRLRKGRLRKGRLRKSRLSDRRLRNRRLIDQ